MINEHLLNNYESVENDLSKIELNDFKKKYICG